MEFEFIEQHFKNFIRNPIKYIITDNGCWECISNKPINSGYIKIKKTTNYNEKI